MIAVDALLLAGIQLVSGALSGGVLSYNNPETAVRDACSAPVRKRGDRGGPRTAPPTAPPTAPLYASAAQRKPELPVELSGVFELRAATL
jgi:hypothetical protein